MNYIKIVNGHVSNNTYLVYKDKEVLIVDPSFDYELIDKNIRNNNFEVKAILLTHGHYDHIASVGYFCKKYGVKVYARKYAIESLKDPNLNLSALSANANGHISFDVMSEELREGKNSIASFDVNVIYTPGHTKGCASFMFNEFIITGDFVFKGTVGRMDLPSASVNAMNESLKKFVKLADGLTVLPGHGQATTVQFEKEHNMFVKEIGENYE